MVRSFYDNTEALVLDGLESIALLRPYISLDPATKTIWLRHHKDTQVALISGGGAGHEPAHAGYVGDGMLTAAVSGSVFASPSVAQILSAITRVSGPSGVLLIIKNYTGDIFHFRLAAEKARVALGIPVEVLTVDDDVSVGRRKSGKVGRRGLAGTVLVHKILGTCSRDTNANISKLLELGNEVVQNLVTAGVSLEHVQIPGRDAAPVSMDDQVELGMGIHNEPGCLLLSPRPPLSDIINMMLNQLLDTKDEDRAYVDFTGARHVVVMVNNLGGLSPLEFGGITGKVVQAIKLRNIVPTLVLSGTYMTSLNGPGFSITLLKATLEMIEYLEAPTNAAGWGSLSVSHLHDRPVAETATPISVNEDHAKAVESSGISFDAEIFKRVIHQSCQNLIDTEPLITQYDTLVGDGDCGVTLSRGARAVLTHADDISDPSDVVKTINKLAGIMETDLDGTSGAIYSIFFTALAAELRATTTKSMNHVAWVQAANKSLEKLQQATPARQGDRTLMDALEPFIKTLVQGRSLADAVAAAKAGMEATKGMKASLGRAVYVPESVWDQVPDPGAQGVVCILEGLGAAIS
ncbi:dihydroxyacetone kinase [Trichoderma arundinaceum]|uniref:Dihydroxyacetone kinase n=1 Tax=Trichoderma arundinaceum TaxID=490622 RepID=A0A395NQ55_TRIAR|nr:dihydroxyacetone kinase [Trichoderma arundinaceum]